MANSTAPTNMEFILTGNQILSLIIFTIDGILAWYASVLVVDNNPKGIGLCTPTKAQYIGMIFYIVAAMLVWAKFVFVFGERHSN